MACGALSIVLHTALMDKPINQAEAMLRRVSPEGRAVAERERRERQRRNSRQIAACVLLALVLIAGLVGLKSAGVEISATLVVAAVLLLVAGSTGAVMFLRKPPVTASALPTVPLTALPGRTAEWLEQRRLALPPPAVQVIDDVSRRLFELGPQLASVAGDAPSEQAVRKLIAIELPELIERYRSVPSSAREATGADAQLLSGLRVIDGEIGRLSNDLASGSFDALTTQNRYLQLKYDGGDLAR